MESKAIDGLFGLLRNVKSDLEQYMLAVETLAGEKEEYKGLAGSLDGINTSLTDITKALSEGVVLGKDEIKEYVSQIEGLKTEFGDVKTALGGVYTQESGDSLYRLVESVGAHVEQSFENLNHYNDKILYAITNESGATRQQIIESANQVIGAVSDVKGYIPIEVLIKANNAERAAAEQTADLLALSKPTGGLPADFDKNRHQRFMALVSSNNEVQKLGAGDMTAAGLAGAGDKRHLDVATTLRIAEAVKRGELSGDLESALYKTVLGKRYESTQAQEIEQPTD